MTPEQFTMYLNQRLDKTKRVLSAKADEYARGDRLSNFHKAAGFLDTTPEAALMGMVIKHVIALQDFIKDLNDGIMQSPDRWDEKIGDIIAYMCLLDAMILERVDNG
jgi:hypothetical protein